MPTSSNYLRARGVPCSHCGVRRVPARDDEEGAKVLGAVAHGGDVDDEPDEAEDKTGYDEREPLLDAIGPDGPD